MPQTKSPIDDMPETDYDSMTIPQLGTMLKFIKEQLDAATSIKAELQKKYDQLSITVLPDRMDEEGMEIVKIADVGRLQVRSDIRCSVPAANKQAVQDWLTEHGHGSLIAPTINSSTLKAWVKECITENNEYPEDLLSVSPYSRATVVKN